MTVLRVLLCLVCASLVVVARASARAIDLGPTLVAAVSDGQRWIAWAPDARTTRLLDGRTGTLTDVPTPDGCSPVSAVGAGQLLWNCTDGNYGFPLLMHIATQDVSLPEGKEELLQSDRAYGCDSGHRWDGIGRFWIQSWCGAYHGGHEDLFNWRAGHYGDPPAYDDRHHVIDLSQPDGSRTLCDPLRLPRNPYPDATLVGEPLYLPIPYEPPWALPSTAEDQPLRIQRCHQHRTRRLDRCRFHCSQATIAGGLVTWMSGGRVRWARPPGPAHTIGASAPGLTLTHAGRFVIGTRHASVVAWRLPGAPPLPDGR